VSKKSDGVHDMLVWIKQRCKQLKKQIDEEKKQMSSFWDTNDYLNYLQAQLHEAVRIKVATEKYMKKLRHQGE
jgi:radical SAM superfamily enzyme